MRRSPSRRWALLASGALIVAPVAAAPTTALAALSTSGTAGGASPAALTPAQVAALSKNADQKVIVLMKDQLTHFASRAQSPLRKAAAEQSQAGVLAEVRQVGGKNVKSFSIINAFAATVSQGEAQRLAANPAVRAVVPDLNVPKAPPPEQAQPKAVGRAAANVTAPPGACPSNPKQPLLEPEALQQTNDAFSDKSIPQAQNVADGHGVKVAFIADGIDINNPDFIRPNGQHVFVDYQDFSGDGPNAPTSGAEAFGDASSIAAQGRKVYDLSTVVNVAHPLPKGCNIRVLGMAPGASLVGIKSFGQEFASTSSIVQGIDWAVNVDHVDVINESFGANPYPDRSTDPISLADDAAVDAGIVVVSSTGDAGTANTIGSPASDPKVISAAATTSFQSYAQATSNGFQLAPAQTFVSNQISSLSSGGITQNGRTPDVVAPGDLNWALCTPNLNRYFGCADFNGNPAPVEQFGGTSESSPLTAGEAALVIQAYRGTHGGADPSPALVKRIITGTATDLGHPSAEQGSGQINALAAVLAAQSVQDTNGLPKARGSGLLTSETQLDVVATPGQNEALRLTVTNVGSHTQQISSHVRILGKTLRDTRGSVRLDLLSSKTPVYIDSFGIPRAYAKTHFVVPAGADRLDAAIAAPEPIPASPVRIILIDPRGVYRAYSLPQGQGNFAHVDVANPPAGTWTAYFAATQGSNFNGLVHFEFVSSKYVTMGRVAPSSLTLKPGESGDVVVHVTAPTAAGDINPTLVLTPSHGGDVTVPMVIRTLVTTNAKGTGTFTGTLTGGNGRGFPAQSQTFFFDVPRGLRDLGVGIRVSGNTHEEILAFLVSPAGEVVGNTSNRSVGSRGHLISASQLQIFQRAPQSGRWELALLTLNPIAGDSTTQPFTGTVAFNMARASATGLPSSPSTKLAAGKPVTATISFTNTGVAREQFFADPRLATMVNLTVVPQSGATVPLPEPPNAPTYWVVPTEVQRLAVTAKATQPVQLDVNYNTGEPEVLAGPQGNMSHVVIKDRPVADGPWFAGATQIGPFPHGAPSGSVTFSARALTQAFDRDITSSTGDIWLQTVDSSAPGATPLVLSPGASGAITVTLTPTGAKGTVVHGFLYVDDFSFDTLAGDELVAFPYSYTVG